MKILIVILTILSATNGLSQEFMIKNQDTFKLVYDFSIYCDTQSTEVYCDTFRYKPTPNFLRINNRILNYTDRDTLQQGYWIYPDSSSGSFQDGIKQGHWKESFYNNSRTGFVHSGKYSNGYRVGIWTISKKGHVVTILHYKKGKLVEIQQINDQGIVSQIREISQDSGFVNVKTIEFGSVAGSISRKTHSIMLHDYFNDKKFENIHYLKHEVKMRTLTDTIWNHEGTLISYSDRNSITQFYSDGSLYRTCTYHESRNFKACISYFQNGQFLAKEFFDENGQAIGIWEHYNQDGSIWKKEQH